MRKPQVLVWGFLIAQSAEVKPLTGVFLNRRTALTKPLADEPQKGLKLIPYSHSIVPGGLEVMSYTTRLTPLTSLTMRLEIASSSS